MQQSQAGATLKGRDLEKIGTPESIERDLLQDLFQCLLFLPCIGRGVAGEPLAQ
ncbi:hypothetical protein [Thiocystis minor]|uniref:hypothetical protein n=1 Tax=Thiocystis minor TaxID=61597 RepID=UPI001F5E11C5|nr:hypothetical protein [Thiocystis minor]